MAMLSGELTIEQRAAVINRFRAGNEKILITTNVSARGIDVAQVGEMGDRVSGRGRGDSE